VPFESASFLAWKMNRAGAPAPSGKRVGVKALTFESSFFRHPLASGVRITGR
jgi:hypothetical protein